MSPGNAGVSPAFALARKSKAGGTPAFPGMRVLVTMMLVCLACHRTNIDRAQWQSMSANEKSLYVRTLLGHEKTKDAKGGNDHVFTRSIDDYVKGIDDAYARGDTRTVDAIFETMGSRR
ncbi:MAG TPA: hypothetical protein VHY33_09345 [Thermoanaerobaculia bacterium]|nr:hypothetical protein [Thermoanaerobaculia bacterium]